MWPVSSASVRTTSCGEGRSTTITGNTGPCARNSMPCDRSIVMRPGVSASTPKLLPSGRTASTHGCDW